MTELLTKEELLSIAVEHRKWLKNIKTWELHAQRHNLPSVATYEKCFGSWRATKNAVRLHPLYSNTDLIMIAERNAAHFTTISGWNEYADKNNLPNAFTFMA
ncbi:hypothetical protein ACH0BF_16255 [Pseudobacillus sp. 179-B 2D1 NHS]|uniref:hypothetical protein n=1 Tax=Pseudobacillus sp. 179-B 2D1 NHS TaxID=3374292 RepID=UPI0038799648